VHVLGQGLGESVGQCLQDDGRIVVVGGFEGGNALFNAMPGGNRKGTDVVVVAVLAVGD